jgi:hydrogenase assembly chaperone HypC/HupF
MCMAVPCEVLRVADEQAEVLYEGKPLWVRVAGIPDLAPGEYVAVYAGKALQRLTAAEAEDARRLIDQLASQEDPTNE